MCALAGTRACLTCSNAPLPFNYEIRIPKITTTVVCTLDDAHKKIKKIEDSESIMEDIEEIEYLIRENKKLQKKYPNRVKGLEISLQSLEELRKEMLDSIQYD